MTDYKKCAGCGRSVRRARTTVASHPGTVAYGDSTHCSGCKSKGVRKKGPNIIATTGTLASLDAYMANRRARGIPAKGLRRTEPA